MRSVLFWRLLDLSASLFRQVYRSTEEQEILYQLGASTLIIHLSGVLFFGSASSCLDEVPVDYRFMPCSTCILINTY